MYGAVLAAAKKHAGSGVKAQDLPLKTHKYGSELEAEATVGSSVSMQDLFIANGQVKL